MCYYVNTKLDVSRFLRFLGPVPIHRYAILVAIATFCLIFVGGLVTSTGSGLSVPDWPLSFGTLFPQMVGGVRFEHTHRLVAGCVVILMAILLVWIMKREPRAWVRRLALWAMAAIVLQAILGGMTVLLKLPPSVSVAHAGLAQAFFCLVVSIAVVTSPGFRNWDLGFRNLAPNSQILIPNSYLVGITTAAIYIQILLGAVMRHIGAGLAIPDFPLSFGALVPPSFNTAVSINYAHRVGAVVVAFLVVFTAMQCFRTGNDRLRKLGGISIVLLVLQISLGGLTVITQKAVIPTTLHVAVGALLLVSQLVIVLKTARLKSAEMMT